MDTAGFIVALLGSNTITAVFSNWLNRKKTKAEAVDVAMSGTVKWAESMREDILRLTKDIDDMRLKYEAVLKENSELRIRVAHLELELQMAKGAR